MADLRAYFAGVAIADNLATPANDVLAVGTFNMWYDGSNWDMALGDSTDGLLVNLGANNDVSVTGSVTCDTELAAAAALSDDFSNPNTAPVGAFMMIWDSATWDRAPGTTADGLLVNLGGNNDVSISGAVDTELPAAAALADDASTPTAPAVGAFGMWYDGTTWDMARGDATDGLLVNLGANNDVSITGSVDTELPAAAALTDDYANPTPPAVGAFLMGWDDGNTNWNRAEVDDAGHLQVDVLTGGGVDTPTNPVNEYETSAALAAGSTADLSTSEVASKKLVQVTVWASVAYKAFIHTVDNDVESTDPVAVGGAPAHTSWAWAPSHRNYVTLGATAGLDAFRAKVTNLDDNNAADVYAHFEMED